MNIGRIQIRKITGIFVSTVIVLLSLVPLAKANDQKTILMLGGTYCESYPKEITKVLMGVKGVKTVDLNSLPGHAIVLHDDSVQSKSLVEAIKSAKGDGWYCTGQVMDNN